MPITLWQSHAIVMNKEKRWNCSRCPTKHLVGKQTTKILNCYGLVIGYTHYASRPGSSGSLTFFSARLSIQKGVYRKRPWCRKLETFNSSPTVRQTSSYNMTNVLWFSRFYSECSRTLAVLDYRIKTHRESNTEHCDLLLVGKQNVLR